MDWISFEGSVVPMEWGESVFTVLPIPDEVHAELASQNAKRVEMEINDAPLNVALTKAPVIDQVFVYTGKSVLKSLGIEPGEWLDVRVRKTDPDAVKEPKDVIAALRQCEALELWRKLTPGKKRGYLHQINSAKRPATRQVRIEKLILEMRGTASS